MSPPDPSLDAEVAAAAARYRLRLGTVRYRGRTGSRRGLGVGSSLEFLDFRDYVPGDDLRHVDWRAYARTNELRIRLHQEEVAPYVDVLVDPSASMVSTAAKERAVRALVQVLPRWARREGAAARVLVLGGSAVDPAGIGFTDAATAPALPTTALRPSSVRVLVTDGLWQGDPVPLLQRAMAGASQFACVQVLDPWELSPTADGATTLVDVETGDRREVQLDARSLTIYRERLQRLCDGLRGCVLGQGGVFVQVEAAALPAMCARELIAAGVVEPA